MLKETRVSVEGEVGAGIRRNLSAEVVMRADHVRGIQHSTGQRVVHHADGTRVFHSFAVVTENFPDWKSWCLLAAAFAASFWGKVNPILVILGGAVLGLLIY